MVKGSRNSSKGKSLVKKPDTVSVADTITAYLHDCYAQGSRDTTIKTYAAQLVLWSKWCQANEVERIQDVEAQHVVNYTCEMRKAKLSSITVRSRVVTIRAVLRYAQRQGYITGDCLSGFRVPKAIKPAVYMATEEEMQIIFEAIERHWAADINPKSRFRNPGARSFFMRRDRGILAVQLSVGLRISETLALKLEDYSRERKELHIRHSKTGRPRAVPVSEHLARMIAAWLAVRPQAAGSDFLFVSEYGEQLHGMAWSRQFQRYLAFARAEGHKLPRITLSSIRHIPATAMAEVGGVYQASLLMGHTSTKTTETSYIHRNTKIIRPTHEIADPLAGILAKASPKKAGSKKIV